MKTHHTPGPWRHVYGAIMANGEMICDIPNPNWPNARLIAAAPDLLAVLSAIVSDYHALQRSQGATASLGAEFTAGEWLGSRLGGHIAQAELAIAKAEGRAE